MNAKTLKRLTDLGLQSGPYPFTIDGLEMPMPDEWLVTPQIMTSDAKRTVTTGRLQAKYLQTVWVTEWTYRFISQDDYDVLYDAYILSCGRNKSIEHAFTTLDSNTGQIISYTMYTQDDFKAPLYYIRNGKRWYRDVTFTFVGVGGGD